MTRRYITPEEKEVVISICEQGGHSVPEIAAMVNMAESTVYRLLALYKRTGSVVRKPLVPGRPRMLRPSEVDVSVHQCSNQSSFDYFRSI